MTAGALGGWIGQLRKDLFILAAAAALPILLFAVGILVLVDRLQESALQSMLERAATTAAQAVDARLAAELAALQALAAAPVTDVAAFRRQVEGVMALHDHWRTVSLADIETGREIFAVGGSGEDDGPVLPAAKAVDAALRAEAPQVALLRDGESAGEDSVVMTVPVTNRSGARMVLAAWMSAGTFMETIARQAVPAGWTVALLDRDHVAIGAAGGPSPSFLPDQGGRDAYMAFGRASISGWTAAVGAPAAVIKQPMRQTEMAVAGGGIVALGLATLLARSLAHIVARRQEAECRLLSLEALETAERRLSDIARNFPGAIFRRVLHRDGRISYPYCSPAVAEFFGDGLATPEGKAPEAIVAGLLDDEDANRWLQAIRRSARDLMPMEFEARARTLKGWRWIRVVAHTHADGDGNIVWDGVALDITDLKETEARLEASLAEKDILLREIHHRVRNNLQVISSLLQIEALQIDSPGFAARMGVLSRRISVLGRIHEQLYQSTDFSSSDFGAHLRALCGSLAEAYGLPPAVSLKVEVEPLFCDIDTAIPLGLIAHELLSNSMLHAFPAEGSGEIRVRLRRLPECGKVEMTVADTGVGLPPAGGGTGLGMRILRALADQLGADVALSNDEGGCRAVIRLDAHRFTA